MERRQDRRASPFVLRGQITAVALRGRTGMGRGGGGLVPFNSNRNKQEDGGGEQKKKNPNCDYSESE